jgi:NADPH2:quinone reductase
VLIDQMAKIRGYKVIGTTSSSKEAVGKATGVDELIVLGEAPGTSYEDYTTVDVVKRVMEITKGEVGLYMYAYVRIYIYIYI